MRVSLVCVLLVALMGAALREYTIDGEVVAVDWQTYKVQVKRSNGKVSTVQIIQQTNVRVDGRPASWRDIKTGQTIRTVVDLNTMQAIHFGIYDQIDRP